MFGTIIVDLLLQLVFTVGIITVFGLLIALCNKTFYANFGSRAKAVCYITGFVGTPVHELSHALLCVLFRHRITEIKLFRISSQDGTLGYVNHSYNRNSIYQRIGNFFIGTAPVICITALLYLIAALLIPEFTDGVSSLISDAAEMNFGRLFAGLWNIICLFFAQASTWQWWVFIFAGMLLSLHMTLSPADIRGALSGLVTLTAAMFAADMIMGYAAPAALSSITRALTATGCAALCFFTVALIISLIAVGISFLLRPLFRNK